MTKASDRYYLLPDEDEPYRACKSKRFITKVMFMCAVSRPVFSLDGQTKFDGKWCQQKGNPRIGLEAHLSLNQSSQLTRV